MSCYRPFEELALAHLAELGVRWVEMHAPAVEKVEETKAALKQCGLRVSMVQARAFLERDEFVEDVARQCGVARELGAERVLLNIASNGTEWDVVVSRLRAAGDAAEACGVTLAIESHPDLAHNGAAALRTIEAVGHPRVRLNFDPANIYYFNEGLEPVAELAKCAAFVVGVHLKDSPGGYQERVFPVLGRGRVDFGGLFEVLGAAGFAGPYTVELENPAGATPTPDEVRWRVAESVAFLRRRFGAP